MDRYGEGSNRIGPPPAAHIPKNEIEWWQRRGNPRRGNLVYLGPTMEKEDQKVLYVREKRFELQALLGLRNNLARTMANKCGTRLREKRPRWC